MQPLQNGPPGNAWRREAKAFTTDDNRQCVPGGSHRRVLVVDDNPVALWAFEKKLKACGFVVTTVADPALAGKIAQQSNAQVIILDLNFFKADFESGSTDWTGFTVIRWLRRFPDLAQIPVIVVSGDDPARSEQKSLAEGAVAYFQKPVDSDRLLSAIRAVLEPPADPTPSVPAATPNGPEDTCEI